MKIKTFRFFLTCTTQSECVGDLNNTSVFSVREQVGNKFGFQESNVAHLSPPVSARGEQSGSNGL